MTLELKQVELRVDDALLVRDIDFALAPGKVGVIIGANGAGKTSLLRLMCNEIAPSEGTVTLDGRSLGSISNVELARRLAILPQHSTLDFPFRVCEVVEMGRIPHLTGKRTNEQIVEQVMERMQLAAMEERIYTSLSGGEKQRVQIARVLCQLWDCLEGGYLMFDEPTAPLDLAHQLSFLDLARDLASRQASVLLVMHDINLAIRCADTIAIMRDGSFIACGSPQAVVTPDNIRSAFDVDVSIARSEDGIPVVYSRGAI